MTDVACFCGRCYSFWGDAGVCPGCGECAALDGVSAAEVRGVRPAREVSERAFRSGADPHRRQPGQTGILNPRAGCDPEP